MYSLSRSFWIVPPIWSGPTPCSSATSYERNVLQGDISHPEVWQKLVEREDLARGEPTIILGTGKTEENLRTALWIKRKYPNALVFARTNDKSTLAVEVEDADCWGSEPVLRDGELIGYVTSGGYGWRIGKSLAVGWIDATAAEVGTRLKVQILERLYNAEVIADPAYDPANLKLRS